MTTQRPSCFRSCRFFGRYVAGHHVEHDVDAARKLPGFGCPVVVLVEDGVIGAERAHRLGLVFGAHRRQHRGAERLGELDRRRADAARAAMDQHAFAGLELPALEEVVPDGEVVLRQRRRAQHVEPLRWRQALRRRRRAVLGVGAARRERADRIAQLPPRDPCAQCRDSARGLEARQVRRARRRRIEAGTLGDVRPIDARRRDLDQDLAVLGLRHRPRRRHQRLGPARLLDLDAGHRGGKCAHGRPFGAMGAMVGLP